DDCRLDPPVRSPPQRPRPVRPRSRAEDAQGHGACLGDPLAPRARLLQEAHGWQPPAQARRCAPPRRREPAPAAPHAWLREEGPRRAGCHRGGDCRAREGAGHVRQEEEQGLRPGEDPTEGHCRWRHCRGARGRHAVRRRRRV
ncbi:hypothetical protein BN1723_019637, partial [Verticillium longisporum]